ncbi:MAG TPA: hypothetical protein V6D43_04665 [Candidatus Sericytochromatia bacterium]|jgi:hypothetical protein
MTSPTILSARPVNEKEAELLFIGYTCENCNEPLPALLSSLSYRGWQVP